MKSKRKVATMHIDTRELIITNIIPNGGAGFGSVTDTQRVDSTLIKPLKIPAMET